MRKIILWLVGAGVALGIVGSVAIQVPAVQDTVFARIAGNVVTAGTAVADPDALTVLFCGTGGPFPDPERAGPCTAIFAGERLFIVDAGTGGAQRLGMWRVQSTDLEAVLLTHLHSDHISGLGDFALNSWAAGRRNALALYGPPGTENVAAGFELAFKVDAQSRIDHHGEEIFAPAARHIDGRPFLVADRDAEVVVLEEDRLKITAFLVNHEPLAHAVGYRFDYGGRSVVISGDTVADENMVRFGADADLMIHEAMGMDQVGAMIEALQGAGNADLAKILTDASEVHTSAADAARLAQQANVDMLVYNHIVPPMPVGFLEEMFLRGVADTGMTNVRLGFDGLVVRLPVDRDEIEISEIP